jgi:hypothetical protein
MLSSAPVPFDELSGIGFMLGGGTIVLMFGAIVVTILRVIYWHERRRLIEFCTSRWRGEADQ